MTNASSTTHTTATINPLENIETIPTIESLFPIATTEKKEGITMTNVTTNAEAMTSGTAEGSKGMTAKEFKQSSYDAYLAYVSLIEGKSTTTEAMDALSPLMTAYGYTLTLDNLVNTLTVKMTAFGKDKGEQAKKVKSIATFRAFVKGGWADVATAPVHSNAGKNPAEGIAKAKAGAKKGPTKAELEAELAELRAKFAA